jgi:hypothetical protein
MSLSNVSVFFSFICASLNPLLPSKKTPKSHYEPASSGDSVSHTIYEVYDECGLLAIRRQKVAVLPPFTFPIHLSTPSTAFCLHPRGFGWFADDSHALHFLRFVLLLFSDGRPLRPIPCFPSMHHCLILLLFCILSSR